MQVKDLIQVKADTVEKRRKWRNILFGAPYSQDAKWKASNGNFVCRKVTKEPWEFNSVYFLTNKELYRPERSPFILLMYHSCTGKPACWEMFLTGINVFFVCLFFLLDMSVIINSIWCKYRWKYTILLSHNFKTRMTVFLIYGIFIHRQTWELVLSFLSRTTKQKW